MVGSVEAIDNSKLLAAARSVPCIEVIDGPAPERAKRVAGPFYPEQGELLAKTLSGIQRRKWAVVAIDADGFANLYRRPRK